MFTNKQRKEIINRVAVKVRRDLLFKYNGFLTGKCIEATDTIIAVLQEYNIVAEAMQVFVLYELFESCPEQCWEEHWLVKFKADNKNYYIDVTMDQFQWAFERELPQIYCDTKLPRFYLRNEKELTKALKDCGWNDWYNTGNYYSNFRYYD